METSFDNTWTITVTPQGQGNNWGSPVFCLIDEDKSPCLFCFNR
jgi:hypothetical protein